MSYRAFKFIVSGRVQDVNYRAFAKGIAHDAGVVGWIANDTVSAPSHRQSSVCAHPLTHQTGQVVGEAQGSEGALDRLYAFSLDDPKR